MTNMNALGQPPDDDDIGIKILIITLIIAAALGLFDQALNWLFSLI